MLSSRSDNLGAVGPVPPTAEEYARALEAHSTAHSTDSQADSPADVASKPNADSDNMATAAVPTTAPVVAVDIVWPKRLRRGLFQPSAPSSLAMKRGGQAFHSHSMLVSIRTTTELQADNIGSNVHRRSGSPPPDINRLQESSPHRITSKVCSMGLPDLQHFQVLHLWRLWPLA